MICTMSLLLVMVMIQCLLSNNTMVPFCVHMHTRELHHDLIDQLYVYYVASPKRLQDFSKTYMYTCIYNHAYSYSNNITFPPMCN